jgi:hypothetical protein
LDSFLERQVNAGHESYAGHGVTCIDLILGVEKIVTVYPKLEHIGQLI